MKKNFLSLIVCSLLLGGAATTTVSCSDDYDADITSLNEKTAGLTSQLSALQEALTANQTAAKQAADAASKALAEAQEAAKKGDTALQEAKNAEAVAELAKEAAATAKAEAIAEAVNQLKPLIEAASAVGDENAKEIAALTGRIDGIEKGLANIDLTDINKQLGTQAESISENAKAIKALEVQVAALEKLKTDLATLNGTVSDLEGSIGDLEGSIGDLEGSIGDLENSLDEFKGSINGLEGKISTIESTIEELKGLSADVQANKKSINDIQTELNGVSAKISTAVDNAVNTLAGVLAQRLTSVTLMPDLYVDGIPTISFESAKYKKLVYTGGVWKYATSGQVEYIVSNDATEAHYRLNPGTITENDIDKNGMGYVTRIATSRAGEKLDDIVNVARVKVEGDGTMTVNLNKSNIYSLNRDNNEIYTVSLKVPVADKHLLKDAGETEAAVYSEFTRLEETYFQPELAFVSGEYIGDKDEDVSHLSDSTTIFQKDAGMGINKQIVYNEKYDLYELVEGCKFFAPDTHKAMNLEELRSYGFDIKFGLPKEYVLTEPDKTNQQKFVELSGDNNNELTPITSDGTPNNKTIIGKQPIIRAELHDVVNKNVVAVRYFKVIFTAEPMEPIKIPLTIDEKGTPCEGASHDFTWDYISEKVLQEIGESGMSKEAFTRIYGRTFDAAKNITPANDANDNNGKLEAFLITDNYDASIPVMTWTLTTDQISNGELKVGENKVTVNKTVTFVDPEGLNPNVVLNLTMNVITEVADPTLGNVDGIKWQNNTMKVYPVPMKLNSDGSVSNTAEYATNILEGRIAPYVKGLYECGRYDIAYDRKTPSNVRQGIKELDFESPFGHWKMTAENQNGLKKVIFSIEDNEQGKALASKGGTVNLDWWTDFNGLDKNKHVFATTKLEIVPILTLNTVLGAVIVDNSVAQTINVAKNYSMTDAYGNLVAKEPTADQPLADKYYKYYGVKTTSITFGAVENIADDAAGTKNVRKLAAINMTVDINNTTGELTFQNNGAPLQTDAFILVPVSVEHKWGTLTGTIAVPLKKGLK